MHVLSVSLSFVFALSTNDWMAFVCCKESPAQSPVAGGSAEEGSSLEARAVAEPDSEPAPAPAPPVPQIEAISSGTERKYLCN